MEQASSRAVIHASSRAVVHHWSVCIPEETGTDGVQAQDRRPTVQELLQHPVLAGPGFTRAVNVVKAAKAISVQLGRHQSVPRNRD